MVREKGFSANKFPLELNLALIEGQNALGLLARRLAQSLWQQLDHPPALIPVSISRLGLDFSEQRRRWVKSHFY